ncbi:cytochrome P450 [Streptomyces sp. KM273126]|uniref:cytochrome P450 n=1 Tax=Streptomyces sp. KM273126 TaxID=2545247 RepID=UPI00103E4E35|nr:cytochrome P450 [Streptomyces sp. KM273126]MBA2807751.1 cytochrome P450 [Streptomyces sp. KM273126]
MSSAVPSTPPPLPLTRRNPFDPPEELGLWRDEAPIRRMTYSDGHVGWLVTGQSAARAVLSDPRFSCRAEIQHPPMGPPDDQQSSPAPPGFFLLMDPPDHTRYRRLLTGQFTVRRMKSLEPRIAAIVADHLDAMAAAGPPADLVQEFALPVPSLVICELLGVPYADRAGFQRDSVLLISFDLPEEEREAALQRMTTYLAELTAHKRTHPADDLLSGLAARPEPTDTEIAGMASLLLLAGHETTANMLALGTFALLQNPTQLEAVRDAATVGAAVEELLRHLSIVFVVVRTAREDIEIEGRPIRAGESVTVSLAAANRDPRHFPAAERLDVAGGRMGHLAFGHGVHQCLGQQLARTEMRLAYPALLRRFPALRLAIPAEQVPLRAGTTIHGVTRLPVTW